MSSVLFIVRRPENAAMALQHRLPPLLPRRRLYFVSPYSAEFLPAASAFVAEADILPVSGLHLGAVAEFRAATRLHQVAAIGAGVDNLKDHPALRGEERFAA